MGQRLQLHELLKTLCNNVYFQEPDKALMVYPAIVYKRDYSDTKFANNAVYARKKRYQVTVIDRNPDSAIPDLVENLPLCSFDRFFPVDGLNHTAFKLYF